MKLFAAKASGRAAFPGAASVAELDAFSRSGAAPMNQIGGRKCVDGTGERIGREAAAAIVLIRRQTEHAPLLNRLPMNTLKLPA